MKFGVLCFSRPKDSPQATLGYVKCSGWWCGVELSASTPLVLQFEVRKPSTPSIMSNGASAELHANSATFFFGQLPKKLDALFAGAVLPPFLIAFTLTRRYIRRPRHKENNLRGGQ